MSVTASYHKLTAGTGTGVEEDYEDNGGNRVPVLAEETGEKLACLA